MEGISLGSAFLRLYGDRSALDRELETLKRYTDQLERQGIKVKFDADTGQASREIDAVQNRLNGLNEILRRVGEGLRGDSSAWAGLTQALGGIGGAAGGAGGGLGQLGGALGGAMGMASRALPVLGQLGLAAQGLQAIFFGVSAAVNSVLGPLQQLSQEAGRFNQQVAEAGIFTSQSFAILGPDGKGIEGTANQMRAVRGVITREFKEIQKEVAQISGATSAEIYEGFNLILQNSASLGEKGQDLGNIRKLSTRVAAAANTLGVPGQQLRSEVQSLVTGDVQMYDQLAMKLYGAGAREKIQQLQSEGKYYDDLMQKLEKLYDGQKVLAASLSNVQSNFQDVFQTIATEGGQALERGLARAMQAVLQPLNALQGSFAGLMRSVSEGLEPVVVMVGEIVGWLVPLGSILASVLRPALELIGLVGGLAGLALPFRQFGEILTVIAKVFELWAARISALLRPFGTFLRVLTQVQGQSREQGFQAILKFFDDLIEKADAAAAVVARPFVELAKRIVWIQGKLGGLSDKQILGRQADVEAEFTNSLGGGEIPELRSLNLQRSTTTLLEERAARLGTGSTRRLNEAKELSQLVQDRIKNEVQGLEQALRLMGAQKTLQEQLNQLAEGRRGLESSRANFAVQLASSPEARLEAEERRNDLALRQEQERINERRALLGTEREMLQMQLQIQLRQQRLQQEQLKIQRLEIQIQRDKSQAAIADIRQRMMTVRSNTTEYQGFLRQYQEAAAELKLRNQQLEVVDRTVGLQNEMVGVIQQTNALEARGLDIQQQRLGVQAEMAGLTREQQAQMADLQRQEQEITNERDRKLKPITDEIESLNTITRQLQEQQRVTDQLQKAAESALELKKAQAAAAVQAAEAELKAVQAQQQANDNPTSVRAVIGAQIEALAAGTQGFVSEAEATRKLYDAKQRQLNLEQQQQRQQLEIQQLRESSELRILEMSIQRNILDEKATSARLEAEQQLLKLRQERDTMASSMAAAAGDGSSIPIGTWVGGGYPPAPVLPPPPGAQRPQASAGVQGGAQISPRQKALLDTIAWAEGTYNQNGYRTMFTGRLFSDLSRHPRQINRSGRLASDAAGRYQFLSTTWDGAARAVGASDFGPRNQDMAALYLAGKRGINTDAPLNRAMIAKLAPEWASFPTMAGGSAYAGQGAKRSDALLRFYNERLAAYGNDPFAASAAAAAQPDTTSLQNQLRQNTTALNNSSKRLEELEKVNKQFQEVIKPAAEEQQAAVRGTLATTLQAQQEAQRMERIRAQVTAEVLNTGRGRLAAGLTESISGTLGNSVRGVLQQLFQGQGFDLAGLAESISQTMAERFTGALIDAALAPIEQAITQNLFRQFSGVDVEEQARQVAQQQAADGQQRAADTMQRAADTMLQAAQGPVAAKALPFSGSTPDAAIQPLSGDAFTLEPLQVALSSSAEGFGQSMDAASGAINVVATTAGQAAGGFESLMQSFGRVAAVLGGVAMGVGGAQQMSKGGTYNTLMGLAGIFGSIGSIAGLFGGPRPGGGGSVFTMPMLTGVPGLAGGGPATSNQPYLVGEQGMELFIPSTSGTVIPNDQTRALLASRNALAGMPQGQGGMGVDDPTGQEGTLGQAYAGGSNGRSGAATGSAFAAARQALAAASSITRERMTERVLASTMTASSKPIDIRYQSEVINQTAYVTAEQFERGMASAAERGRALTLGALKNSVKARRQVGI